jgi:hypothetical protein
VTHRWVHFHKIAVLCGWVLFVTANPALAANYKPTVGIIIPSSDGSNINDVVTFTSIYSDRDGWQDIKYAYLLINKSTTGSKCFYAYYDKLSNKLYLRNDNNTAWLGPDLSNIIENSYVKLDCSKSFVSGSGDTLTITWNVAFKSTFVGAKNMYLQVVDNAGASNGWTKKGAWKINNTLLSISINPKLWNIGSAEVNSIVTMTKVNRIAVTNDGNVTETFTLALIDPPGWTASIFPGPNTYVLSGVFCGFGDVPSTADFNKEGRNEDVLSTKPKKATKTTLGYAGATTSGASVPRAGIRYLYLQFISPTRTDKIKEQEISVIVSCQTP